MSNVLVGNPLVIDTYSASALFSGYIQATKMVFTNYANTTDTLEVQDKNGKTIVLLKGKADLSNVEQTFDSTQINGLLVPVTKTDTSPNPAGTLLLFIL